jgi:hypothetical protein
MRLAKRDLLRHFTMSIDAMRYANDLLEAGLCVFERYYPLAA